MQIRAVEPGGRERHGCALEAGGGGGRRYLHSARVAACHHADLCDLMCSWISRQLRTPWARAAADQQRSRHDSPTAAARLLPRMRQQAAARCLWPAHANLCLLENLVSRASPQLFSAQPRRLLLAAPPLGCSVQNKCDATHYFFVCSAAQHSSFPMLATSHGRRAPCGAGLKSWFSEYLHSTQLCSGQPPYLMQIFVCTVPM